MKKLIINADDFGFSEAVNRGIIEAYKQGVVSSCTLMANMPGFDDAIKLLSIFPDLPVGVHLNLTTYFPLLKNHKTLTKGNGHFLGEHQEMHYDPVEMQEELIAQIEKVLAAGVNIDHLDSHHYVHTSSVCEPVIRELTKRYPYPIRGNVDYPLPNVKQTVFLPQFYNQDATLEKLKELCSFMEDGQVYDMMCHPAYVDDTLLSLSSYTQKREEERKLLCSKQIQQLLKAEQIEILNYKQL